MTLNPCSISVSAGGVDPVCVVLQQKLAKFSCEGLDCTACGLCQNYFIVPLSHRRRSKQNKNRCMWLWFNESLFMNSEIKILLLHHKILFVWFFSGLRNCKTIPSSADWSKINARPDLSHEWQFAAPVIFKFGSHTLVEYDNCILL